MVEAPGRAGISQVSASPLWSVRIEQPETPPQAESCTLLVALQAMVAPLTGVTPSAASTRTLTGLVACVPTGVLGLRPISRTRESLAAAPYVRTPVIVLDAPLAGLLMVMLCSPS